MVNLAQAGMAGRVVALKMTTPRELAVLVVLAVVLATCRWNSWRIRRWQRWCRRVGAA